MWVQPPTQQQTSTKKGIHQFLLHKPCLYQVLCTSSAARTTSWSGYKAEGRFRNRLEESRLQIWQMRCEGYSAFADVRSFGIGVDAVEKDHAASKSRHVCMYVCVGMSVLKSIRTPEKNMLCDAVTWCEHSLRHYETINIIPHILTIA